MYGGPRLFLPGCGQMLTLHSLGDTVSCLHGRVFVLLTLILIILLALPLTAVREFSSVVDHTI